MYLIYPKLRKLKQKTFRNDGFFGICRKERVSEGYFYDMNNISGDKFPVFSVKNPEALWTGETENSLTEKVFCDGKLVLGGKGITAARASGDKFCYCTDSHIFINGKRLIAASLKKDVSVRTIVPFGRNIFIIPDGEYIRETAAGYNVRHTCTYHTSETAAFSFCDKDGNEVNVGYEYDKPEFPEAGDRYISEDEGIMTLYKYSEDGVWEELCVLYAKITSYGIGSMFLAGDHIYVTDAFFDRGECKIKKIIDMNNIVVSGILYGEMSAIRNFTAEKKIPAMDFAAEHGNRIWGCRYGKNNNGEFVNEIYASALGDPGAWETFEGASTDSYQVSLGCPGEFTGVTVLGSDVLFFKEEYIIRVSGDSPADFSVTTYPARGVQRGCHNSIVNINEQLFYKSRYGVIRYDGTFPAEISENLGNVRYEDAVAEGIGNKYYIAMTDTDGNRSIFVFHLNTSQWYREDDKKNTRFMVRIRNCLYYVCLEDESDGKKYYSFRLWDSDMISQAVSILSPDDKSVFAYIPEKRVCWSAETGKTGDDCLPARQILRRIHITLSLDEGSNVSMYIKPDNENEWHRLCFIDTPVNKVFTVPVSTPPCHSYTIRLEGKGQCRVINIIRQTEINQEVRNIG